MENKKLLKEAINEIQLDDIYSAASKLEQQTISLAEMSLKFSDKRVKQQALLLKKQAGQFTELISGILTSDEEKEINTLSNVEDVEVNNDVEMNESKSDVINLSEAFKNENNLPKFKETLNQILKESNIKKVNLEKLENSFNAKELNEFLNELYDSANENNIKIEF